MFAKEKDYDSIKVVDFGLSMKYNLDESAALTEKCGTAIYMAPEVFLNNEYSKVRISFQYIFLVCRHLEFRNHYVYIAYRLPSFICQRR